MLIQHLKGKEKCLCIAMIHWNRVVWRLRGPEAWSTVLDSGPDRVLPSPVQTEPEKWDRSPTLPKADQKNKGEHDEKEKLCLNSQFCKPRTSPWRPRSQWTSAACQRCHRTPPLCVACGGKIKTLAVRHWLSIRWWHLVNWTTIFISLPLKPGFERTNPRSLYTNSWW